MSGVNNWVVTLSKKARAHPRVRTGYVNPRRTSLDDMMDVLHSSNEFDSWCTWRNPYVFLVPWNGSPGDFVEKPVGIFPTKPGSFFLSATSIKWPFAAQQFWDIVWWIVTGPLRIVTFWKWPMSRAKSSKSMVYLWLYLEVAWNRGTPVHHPFL